MDNLKVNSIKSYLESISKYKSGLAIEVYSRHADSRKISYSDLIRKIKNLAHLLSPNIKLGDRVILYSLDSELWITSYFVLLGLGAIAVTIDNRVTQINLAEVIQNTTPIFLFTSDISKCESIGSQVNIIDFKTIELDKEIDYIFSEIPIESPAQIVYSSGTWSKPKGITLSHKNILTNLSENIKHFDLNRKDVFLSIIPLSHMYEIMAGMLVPIWFGTKIVYSPLETKKDFQSALRRAQPTKLVLVPAVTDLLFEAYENQLKLIFGPLKKLILWSRGLPRIVRRNLWILLRISLGGKLNQIMVGGAVLQHEIDYFFQGLGVEVDIGYGLSETAPVIAVSFNQNRKPGEVGFPYDVFELSQNDVGELLVRGPSVYMGYWPNITNTDETWFNTGDIVAKDEKGNLYIKGRSKNLFIYSSGDKIFAEDIEFAANKFLSNETCCINIGLGLSNDLKLIVTDPEFDINKLRSHLESELPHFVHINDIVYYGETKLPLTFSRKINRKVLKEWIETVYLKKN